MFVGAQKLQWTVTAVDCGKTTEGLYSALTNTQQPNMIMFPFPEVKLGM